MKDKFEYAMGLIKGAWRHNEEDDLKTALEVMRFGDISIEEMLAYLTSTPPPFDESRLPKHEAGDVLTVQLPKPFMSIEAMKAMQRVHSDEKS